MQNFFHFFLIIMLLVPHSAATQVSPGEQPPLKVGVVGLVHTHVHWILGRPDRGDIEIVGIAEPNRELAQRYAKQHGYSMDIVYDSIEEMLDATQPEAVTAFNTIYDHLKVVEICAPRGIHVMVEKPLAVNWDHARKMAKLARAHNIHLLTNYETTWYGSNHRAYQLVKEGKIGDLRKIVVHDGHQGPEEIGCNIEFLEWLTDPVLNGGGAITDFGCYGANLTNWLMDGQRPTSVTAVTQQFKPEKYPKVDDEATIILTYPKTQAILQPSWNWPYGRKDIEIYGQTGYIVNHNGTDMTLLYEEKEGPFQEEAPALKTPQNDPFAYLEGVIRGKITVKPTDLSALENNLLVVEILEAAKKSAKKGKTVFLK